MSKARGLSLIEVMIVMTIITLSAGLVGPRIGAGMTRIEVYQAEQTIRSFVQMARSRAQRTNLAHFVVLDRRAGNVALIGPDMSILRERALPSGVELVVEPQTGMESIYVPPSGLLRGKVVRVRSRFGVQEVALR